MFERIKRFLFGYRPKEVRDIIRTILDDTIDTQNVKDMMYEIDAEWDSGAENVDRALNRKLKEKLEDLLEKDEEEDEVRLRNWEKELGLW